MLTMLARFKPGLGWKELAAALMPRRNAISRYEKFFSETFRRPYGVMFNYGRSALYALFKVWNLNNAEIICPAYTCVVVAHAVVLSGNIPVFVDCDKEGFNMSLEGIRGAITEKTRGIIVTHVFGYPMDIAAVEKIVEEAELRYGRKIYIIQDCAHSFGAFWHGRMVTTSGDAAIFGLNISKTIHSVFGGMSITGDQHTYNMLLAYREGNFRKPGFGKTFYYFFYMLGAGLAFSRFIYPLVYKMIHRGWLDRFTRYYDEGQIDFPPGWDERPSAIQGRVGMAQLHQYENIIRERLDFARRLPRLMAGYRDIQFPPFHGGGTYSHFVAVVSHRERWLAAFEKIGVQLGTIIDYSIPEMTAYKAYRQGDYPNARFYSRNVINFPFGLSCVRDKEVELDGNAAALVITGDDKLGRRLVQRLEQRPDIVVMVNKGRTWGRVFSILKKRGLKWRVLLKIAWAELGRAGVKISPLPVIRSNRNLMETIQRLNVKQIYLFRMGLIISREVLDSRVEIFNVHCANLPQYKGLGAVDRALRDEAYSQFACLYRVDRSIDGGEIIAKKSFRLSAAVSYRENEDTAYEAGMDLLMQSIPDGLARAE